MAKAVKSAFKWVAHAVGDVVGVVAKPLVRALTPKVPEVNTSSALDFQANPDAGVPYVIGITGTAGTYIYATVGEAKNRNLLFYTILSGGGPIDAYVGFSADGTDVVFDGPDTPESGPYRHLMWQRRQLGATPSAALLPPNTLDSGVLAEWTSAHKTSGYAAAWWVLGADQKAYSTGVPAPIWKLRGARVYDWRLDSTYPGGSGPHRINDPSTWTFTENPAVHAVGWALGRYQNGRRVLGLGCFLSQLVMAKFTEWANVCDANGWKVGGVVYSTDTKWQVLKAICQAGGAYPIPLGAKISVIFNAPRVSIATLTGADIDGEPNIVGTQLRRDRFNRAVPRFRSETNGWQIVPAAPLEVSEFVTQDGGKTNTKELEWPLVQWVDQATQLAAYGICNSREIGPIDLPIIPAWMGLEPGDCITLNEPEFGMTGQKLIILQRSRDLSTAERSISCVTETDSKHPFCLGQSGTPPPLPSLSAVDTLPAAPDEGSWVVSGGTLAGPGGSLPALIVTGAVDDPNAVAIIVEYREILGGGLFGDWIATEWPVSATRIEVGGVKAGANYQVRVRYRYGRNTEDPNTNADIGTVVVGGVDAGSLKGRPTQEVLDDVSANAESLALNNLADQNFRSVQEALNYDGDGRSVKLVALDALAKAIDSLQRLVLLGAVAFDGEAFILNADTVKISEAVTLAQHLSLVSSVVGDGSVTISELFEAVDGQAGRVTIAVNNSLGAATGLDFGVDGVVDWFRIVTSNFQLIDPTGASGARTIFEYADGVLKMGAVEVDTLKVNTVTVNHVQPQNIVVPVTSTGSSTINCDGTDKVIIDHTVELLVDATVIVTCFLSSHFPSGDKNWTATLWIDGEDVYTTGGANGEANIPLGGALPCSAGPVLVQVTLNSHTSVNVTSRTLTSIGPMR